LRPAALAADSPPHGTVLRTFAQLDQHGKIHSCEHFTFGRFHAENSQIGTACRRHVGENDNAHLYPTRFTFFNDCRSHKSGSIVGSIVMASICSWVPMTCFEPRAEFVGKAPVGSQSLDAIIGNSVPERCQTRSGPTTIVLFDKGAKRAYSSAAHSGNVMQNVHTVPKTFSTTAYWWRGF